MWPTASAIRVGAPPRAGSFEPWSGRSAKLVERRAVRAEGKRVNIRAILSNPKLRRELMVRVIIATQAREGIKTTKLQAKNAYDKVREEGR
jgi:hypothetical protein